MPYLPFSEAGSDQSKTVRTAAIKLVERRGNGFIIFEDFRDKSFLRSDRPLLLKFFECDKPPSLKLCPGTPGVKIQQSKGWFLIFASFASPFYSYMVDNDPLQPWPSGAFVLAFVLGMSESSSFIYNSPPSDSSTSCRNCPRRHLTRQFTASPRAMITLEEDEGEEGDKFRLDKMDPSHSLDNLILQRRVRKKKPAVIRAKSAKEALRDMEVARARKVKETQRLTEELERKQHDAATKEASVISDRNVQPIRSAVAVADSAIAKIDAEYRWLKWLFDWKQSHYRFTLAMRDLESRLIALKYSGFDAELAMLAEAYEPLPREYAALKYSSHESAVAELGRGVFVSRHQLWTWKRDRLLQRVNLWIQSYSSIVYQLRSGYIEPRESARRRINQILDAEYAAKHAYRVLKERHIPVEETFFELTGIIDNLSSMRELPTKRRLRYARFSKTLAILMRRTSALAHSLRNHARIRQEVGSELAVARPIRHVVNKAYGQLRIRVDHHIEKMVKGRRHKQDPGEAFAHSLRDFYLEKLKSPPPTEMLPRETSLQLRQLDIIAPFEVCKSGMHMLRNEVKYLRLSLQMRYPAWPHLDPKFVDRFSTKLDAWLLNSGETYSAMADVYDQLLCIDWLRMLQERKLTSLHVPSQIRQRGLFTPCNPITADLARCDQWCETVGRHHGEMLLLHGYINCDPRFWRHMDVVHLYLNHKGRKTFANDDEAFRAVSKSEPS